MISRIAIPLVGLLLVSPLAAAQTIDRESVDRKFVSRLAELIQQFPEDATELRSWFLPRDPTSVLIVLPSSDRQLDLRNAQAAAALEQLRNEYAADLFQLAVSRAKAGDEQYAYRLLFEVLQQQPDHEPTRTILQPSLSDLQLPQASELNATRMSQRERTYGWRSGAWNKCDSAHFTVISNADRAQIEPVLILLETLYGAWDQLFFGYWSPEGRLQNAFEKQEALPRPSQRRHTVVLFATREDYLRQVAGLAPNIEQSKGYYALQRRESLLYLDDESTETSWLHEVTHQLFQERISAKLSVGDRSNFWMVEGFAMLMESLVRHGDSVTLGGSYAKRLQYARFNVFSAKVFRPLESFVSMGQSEFQRDPDVKRLYSQAAGVCQWLMTRNQGQNQAQCNQLLRQLYRSRIKSDALFEALSESPDRLNQEYIEFLRPRKSLIAVFPPEGKLDGLCLAYGNVDAATLEHLRNITSIEWLDLSRCDLTDASLAHLNALPGLQQLFLADTPIGDDGIDALSQIATLRELDLTGTKVTSTGLRSLATLRQLESLSLSDTAVDDRAVPLLLQMPSLRSVNINGTAISPLGMRRLGQTLEVRH